MSLGSWPMPCPAVGSEGTPWATTAHHVPVDPYAGWGCGSNTILLAPIPILGHSIVGKKQMWGSCGHVHLGSWGTIPWSQPGVSQACGLMAVGGCGCPRGAELGAPRASVEMGVHWPLLQEMEWDRGWDGSTLSFCG